MKLRQTTHRQREKIDNRIRSLASHGDATKYSSLIHSLEILRDEILDRSQSDSSDTDNEWYGQAEKIQDSGRPPNPEHPPSQETKSWLDDTLYHISLNPQSTPKCCVVKDSQPHLNPLKDTDFSMLAPCKYKKNCTNHW